MRPAWSRPRDARPPHQEIGLDCRGVLHRRGGRAETAGLSRDATIILDGRRADVSPRQPRKVISTTVTRRRWRRSPTPVAIEFDEVLLSTEARHGRAPASGHPRALAGHRRGGRASRCRIGDRRLHREGRRLGDQHSPFPLVARWPPWPRPAVEITRPAAVAVA